MGARKQEKLPSGMRWRGGRISVSGYDGDAPGGSRHIGTFDSLEDAGRAKAEFERVKERRRQGFRGWTAAEFVKVWCVTDYLRPEATTNMNNRQMVKAFGKDFGGLALREISANPDLCRLWALGGTVRDDLTRFAKGWEGVTLDSAGRLTAPAHTRHARVVAAMFADAVRSGIVDQNPWALLRLPTTKGRQDIEPLPPVTVQALIATADMLFPDVADVAALIATAAYTGLRLGECLGLRWEDLDFEDYRVHVKRQLRSKVKGEAEALPKYGAVRKVVLPPPAVVKLREVTRNLDGFVFHTRTGKRYSERIHHYYWSQVRLGMDPPMVRLAFHELRHFCGSYMADHGATPRDIAHQLGHKDGGILAARLYCHTYTDNANERLSALFGV